MKGGVGAATYASTKAGVIAFTRALVAESNLAASAANLRANVIVPGYIETKMLDGMSRLHRPGDNAQSYREREVHLLTIH